MATKTVQDYEITEIQADSKFHGLPALTDPDADRILFWDETDNALKWLTAGAGITISGTTMTGTASSNAPFDPTARFDFFDDLYADIIDNGWAISEGGGAITAIPEAGHPGIARLDTQTGTTNTPCMVYAVSATAASASGYSRTVLPGGGNLRLERLVRTPTLFAGADTGTMRIGFVDELTGAPTHGLYAQYDSGSANWQLFSIGGASGTVSDATGAQAVGTGWTKLVIEATTNSNATLSVNGVTAGTLATAFSTAGFNHGMQIVKTAGTTSTKLEVDYMWINQVFSPARG